jgi:hypothetical protein
MPVPAPRRWPVADPIVTVIILSLCDPRQGAMVVTIFAICDNTAE